MVSLSHLEKACFFSDRQTPRETGVSRFVLMSFLRKRNEDIVAYLLRARTVEPEKQPLLANGSETKFVFRQRLRKYVPAATDTHETIEVPLETVFSTRSVQRGFEEDNWGNRVSSVRESVRKRGSLEGAAVQRGLERVKLKNLHC
jgi:hypothetical protein